jgi:triphosphoribosyl-dephospho-CoA synthetase
MRKHLLAFLIVASVTEAACSPKPATGDKPMDVRDTVFRDQVQAVEKAKGVQDTVNQEKANLDKAIDANDNKLPVSTD